MKHSIPVLKPILLFTFFVCNISFVHALITDKGMNITVVDENGLPLIGVNIYTKDRTFNEITDHEGRVIVKDILYDTQFYFDYLGYEIQSLSFAQLRQLNGKVQLKPVAERLETVLVVGRRDDKAEEIPYSVQKVSKEEIIHTNPQTTADALGHHANIYIQKSQMGGGSPIIRGFEANRVLLVLDGVRLNNAIYRNGHLQNAITIDNSIIEQMEVIYGPGSLMYGSDALGGVVHFRSKDPKLFFGDPLGKKNKLVESNFFTRYATVNSEKTIHADINIGKEKWAFLTSLNFTDYDDIRSGSNRPSLYPQFGRHNFYVKRMFGEDFILSNEDPNIQKRTGYSQFDFLQKIRFQPNHKVYFIANFQYSTSSDIPRYDRLTEYRGKKENLRFAEWFYGPQTRGLFSLKTRLLQSTSFFDRATIISSFQWIEEDRHERKTSSTWRESSLVDVRVYALTADFDKAFDKKERHLLSYGLDVSHNDVIANAFRTNISDAKRVSDISTRYPSEGSRLSALGSYLNYRWKNNTGALIVNAGLRFSYTNLFAKFGANDPVRWPAFYQNGISTKNGALTWATGITFNSPSQWQIRVLAATAFRSPNIDDFAKFREKNGFVSVPNPNIKPERAFSTELTISKAWGKVHKSRNQNNPYLKLSATSFFTRLKDAIVREAFFLPDGQKSFVSGLDTFFIQANVNAHRAYIYGISGNILLQLNKHLSLKSGLSWTKGLRTYKETFASGLTKIDTLVPQDHIPPIYGQTSLSFTNKSWKLEAVIRYNGSKKVEDYAVSTIEDNVYGGYIIDRTGTSDNIEQGLVVNPSNPFYLGLFGWTTLNFYASCKFHKNFQLNLGVENISDIHYRTFSSGLSAPGRNFIIALRGQF